MEWGNTRYRLQEIVTIARPNVLGNKSFPVYTKTWVDRYASGDIEILKELKTKMDKTENYRIIDTNNGEIIG